MIEVTIRLRYKPDLATYGVGTEERAAEIDRAAYEGCEVGEEDILGWGDPDLGGDVIFRVVPDEDR